MPIEYRTDMCNLKIKIHYDLDDMYKRADDKGKRNKHKCYEVNANVRCKDPNTMARSAIIISVTFIVCAIVIAVALVLRRRRTARLKSLRRSSISLDMARNAMYT